MTKRTVYDTIQRTKNDFGYERKAKSGLIACLFQNHKFKIVASYVNNLLKNR